MKIRVVRNTITTTVVPGVSATTAQTGAAAPGTGILLNGILQQIFVTAPATVDASATMTVALVDYDGNTVWSKASIAASSAQSNTLLTNDTRPALSGYYQMVTTYTAAQTATASVMRAVFLVDEG